MKTAGELNLSLKPNFKILPRLREYSRNKNIRVVGFKLSLNVSPSEAIEAAEKILSPTVDAVVANEWNSVSADRSRHPGSIVRAGAKARSFDDLRELSQGLHELIKGAENDSLS